jgi:hypothetical protein
MPLIYKKKWGSLFLFGVLFPVFSNAATLYMCRAYSGGSFWSNTSCRNQNALVERTVSVPDSLPFDQQVQLGEQARAEGRRLLESPTTDSVVINNVQNAQNECLSINMHIQALDNLARQPQSAQAQDRISEDRRRLRDRQFQIRCR